MRNGAKSVFSPYLRAYYRVTSKKTLRTRVGFSISKKVGNAVVRNRIKRCLKEEFRLSPYREGGLDILFVVSPRIKSLLFKRGEEGLNELRQNFNSLLRRTFKNESH